MKEKYKYTKETQLNFQIESLQSMIESLKIKRILSPILGIGAAGIIVLINYLNKSSILEFNYFIYNMIAFLPALSGITMAYDSSQKIQEARKSIEACVKEIGKVKELEKTEGRQLSPREFAITRAENEIKKEIQEHPNAYNNAYYATQMVKVESETRNMDPVDEGYDPNTPVMQDEYDGSMSPEEFEEQINPKRRH